MQHWEFYNGPMAKKRTIEIGILFAQAEATSSGQGAMHCELSRNNILFFQAGTAQDWKWRPAQANLAHFCVIFSHLCRHFEVEKAEESITLPSAIEHVAPPSSAPAELHHPEEDCLGDGS